MIVRDMNFCNIDILYKTIVDLEKSGRFSESNFSKNFPQFLSNISISFQLDEVTKSEYIFLKMFSTSITKFIDGEFSNSFISRNYSEIYNTSASQLLTMIKNINNDSKIQNLPLENFILPLGFEISPVACTLTGGHLISIISLTPKVFFAECTEGRCIERKKDEYGHEIGGNLLEDFNIYTDESFEDKVVSKFISTFYRFMNEKATYVDFPSDFPMEKYFFDKVDASPVTLNTVINDYLSIDYLNDNMDLIKELNNEYKLRELDKDYTIENTNLSFIINSSVGVFFHFLNIFDKSNITAMQPFSIPINESFNIDSVIYTINSYLDDKNRDNIINLIIRKHGNTFVGSIRKFINDIDNNYNIITRTERKSKTKDDPYRVSVDSQNNNIIKKIEMINNNSNIKFILTLKLSDIDNYITDIEDRTRESSNTYYQFIDIINRIKKYIIAIYKSII